MQPKNDHSRWDYPLKDSDISKEGHPHESGWEMNQRLKKGLWINLLLYTAAITAAIWALLR